MAILESEQLKKQNVGFAFLLLGVVVFFAILITLLEGIWKYVLGIVSFHFHLLRHTFTSNLLASGAPPKDVQGRPKIKES